MITFAPIVYPGADKSNPLSYTRAVRLCRTCGEDSSKKGTGMLLFLRWHRDCSRYGIVETHELEEGLMANRKNKGNSEKAKDNGKTFKASKVMRRREEKKNDELRTLRLSSPPGSYAHDR